MSTLKDNSTLVVENSINYFEKCIKIEESNYFHVTQTQESCDIQSDFSEGFDNNHQNQLKLRSEEFSEDKQVQLKKKLSEELQSLLALCDICDSSSIERVITLNKQERIVAAVILAKLSKLGIRNKKVLTKRIPEQSCGNCFRKIIFLIKKYNKNIKIPLNIPKNMSHPSSHGYQCTCNVCKNQSGLQVLLQGIEEHQRNPSQTLVGGNTLNMSQPSTSSHFEQSSINLLEPTNLFPIVSHYQGYQEEYPTSQASDTCYTPFEDCFQIPQKTESSLGQASSQFPSESDFSVPQYDPTYNQQSSGYFMTHQSQEESLPISLEELGNQPSTSSGFQVSADDTFQFQDEKRSKKILKCQHCEKTFGHKGDYNKHVRKHTKERPYKCQECEKSFSHTSNLHRHERIHSGNKPFTCSNCDKSFNRKDKLESHKNSKSCKNKCWK